MAGIKAGINAGCAGVVDTMCELKIKSPRGVFRDEVGRMCNKGPRSGALLENKAQAKTIRNAVRLLTDEAKEGAIAHFRNDDRRIYNQQSSITPSGNNISVREQQDTRLLAI